MTDRTKSITLIPHPNFCTDRHPSRLMQALRRIRRNRFWLLLFLWTAGALPELVFHTVSSETIHQWLQPRLILVSVLVLVPAMWCFLLCTALPSRWGNRWICTIYTALAFLLHSRRLMASSPVLPENILPLLLMGFPLAVLLALGGKLFSFRPLKSWKQHIPLTVCCVLAQVLVLTLQWPAFPVTDDRNSVPDSQPTLPTVQNLLSEPDPVPTEKSISFPQTLMPDFSLLATREEQEEVARIHRYFAGRSVAPPHEKTGIFQNCNLILITAEGFSPDEVSPEEMPVLSRMFQQGWLFSDFHVPDWGSRADNIYALLTGAIPDPSGENLRACTSNRMPLTMVQQLLRRGYHAWAFHRCTRSNCDEANCLEQLGYEWLGCATGDAASILDRVSDHIVDEAAFTLFADFGSLRDTAELEEALALLTTRLDFSDRLKNTVIVLCAAANGPDSAGSCVIWKPGITAETLSSPASPLDLTPTLSGLFGPEYDTRLYMGRDVFGADIPLVIFPDRSWISENGIDETLSSEVEERIDISAGILKMDYWRYLFG